MIHRLLKLCLFLSLIGGYNYSIGQNAELYVFDDFEKARMEASNSGRILIVDYYTDWCGWCKVMDKNTFTDAAIVNYIDSSFVYAKLDAEAESGIPARFKYRINSFPSFTYHSPDGLLIDKRSGYLNPADYMEELKGIARMNEEGKRIKGVSKDLINEMPEFCYPAFKKGNTREYPTSEEVSKYLDQQTDLFSERSFSVMYFFELDSSYQSLFVEHYKKYEDLYGTYDILRKLERVLDQEYMKIVKSKDETQFKNFDQMLTEYVPEQASRLSVMYRIAYYRKMEQWKEMARFMEIAINRDSMHISSINYHCWHLYQKCDDRRVIKKAYQWMAKVVEDEPTYAYLDTYASLLYKGGKNKDSEKYMNKAIAVGKENGEDVSESEALLKKITGVER